MFITYRPGPKRLTMSRRSIVKSVALPIGAKRLELELFEDLMPAIQDKRLLQHIALRVSLEDGRDLPGPESASGNFLVFIFSNRDFTKLLTKHFKAFLKARCLNHISLVCLITSLS